MATDQTRALESWIRALPASRMTYPAEIYNRAKYLFWRFYTPYHSRLRDMALASGIIHHEGRQDFLLGKVAPGETLKSFISHCIDKGYGNHFIAWHDEGEVVS